jgi:LysR family hydrogen peroxide-inducible transcriptional activator
MSTHLPTLKQLQYLVALEEDGHFGRAADACFVTQSTLSGGIRELESLIGSFWSNAPGGWSASLRSECRSPRRRGASCAKPRSWPTWSEPPAAARRRVADGGDPDHRPVPAPGLLPRLRRQWPELRSICARKPARRRATLHRGQLDCVLLALPYACGEVDSAALFDDRLFVAFPPAKPRTAPAAVPPHRSTRRGCCCSRTAIASRTMRSPPATGPSCAPRRRCSAPRLHTFVQMVDNGLGQTLVPEMALAAGILEGTGVAARPLAADHAYRRIALLWRKASPREKEFRLLAESLKRPG